MSPAGAYLAAHVQLGLRVHLQPLAHTHQQLAAQGTRNLQYKQRYNSDGQRYGTHQTQKPLASCRLIASITVSTQLCASALHASPVNAQSHTPCTIPVEHITTLHDITGHVTTSTRTRARSYLVAWQQHQVLGVRCPRLEHLQGGAAMQHAWRGKQHTRALQQHSTLLVWLL